MDNTPDIPENMYRYVVSEDLNKHIRALAFLFANHLPEAQALQIIRLIGSTMANVEHPKFFMLAGMSDDTRVVCIGSSAAGTDVSAEHVGKVLVQAQANQTEEDNVQRASTKRKN